jgi:SAM-dependent methyltransferase
MSKDQQYFKSESFSSPAQSYTAIMRLLKRYCPHNKPLRILDIGCGTGTMMLEMGRTFPGSRITGIDISHPNIYLCKKRCRLQGLENQLHCICGDYLTTDLGLFDIICANSTLQYLNTPKAAIYEKINSQLADGGIFLNAMPFDSFANRVLNAIRLGMRKVRTPLLDTVILKIAMRVYSHQFTVKQLKQRIPYMYVHTFHFSKDTRKKKPGAKNGWALLYEKKETGRQPGKIRHITKVYQKKRATWF